MNDPYIDHDELVLPFYLKKNEHESTTHNEQDFLNKLNN